MSAQYCTMHAPQESASKFAYRILHMYILELRFPPGKKLSEAEIAALLGVSRTPVHNTFAQLARENMLSVEPQRGTFVPLLDAEQILQIARIGKKLDLATFEMIYSIWPAQKQLMPLYDCVERQKEALAEGSVDRMARLNMEYRRELFALSGYLSVYHAMRRIDADLYRLLRLTDDRTFWRGFVDRHGGIVDALREHDNDTACWLTGAEYETIRPILEQMRKKYPDYFK